MLLILDPCLLMPEGLRRILDPYLMKPEEGLDFFGVWALALYQELPQLIHRSHFGEDVTALILKKTIQLLIYKMVW